MHAIGMDLDARKHVFGTSETPSSLLSDRENQLTAMYTTRGEH